GEKQRRSRSAEKARSSSVRFLTCVTKYASTRRSRRSRKYWNGSDASPPMRSEQLNATMTTLKVRQRSPERERSPWTSGKLLPLRLSKSGTGRLMDEPSASLPEEWVLGLLN